MRREPTAWVAEHQEGGRYGDERGTYQHIQCRLGEIYEYGEGLFAWYCNPPSESPIVKNRLIREAPEWPKLETEGDFEAVFVFPVEKFPEVAKLAKARTRRRVSEEERERLAELSRRHSPFYKSQTLGPGRAIAPLATG